MTDLPALAAAVAEESGIRLDRAGLTEALDQLASEAGEPGAPRLSGESLVRAVVDTLTVKESFFLRQPDQLRTLDWGRLLAAALANSRDRVRVWSAACARGEEPYTLALLASECFARQPAPVDILGTDISDSALEQATAGVYGARAVRHLSDVAKERFFEPSGSGLAVGEALRRLVRFKRHNLTRDAMPPVGETRFDLVVCRNVLIYFEASAVERFARLVPQALISGGRLVLGAADRLCLSGEARRELAQALDRPAAPQRPLRREPPPAQTPAGTGTRVHAAPGRPDRAPRDVTDPALAGALRLADLGRLDEAAKVARHIVAHDPMNAPAHFVMGTVELARGEAANAARHFRSALYADPTFAVAAFQLGRAQDALADDDAARRAYRLALKRLDGGVSRYPWLLEDTDAADIAVACAVRLRRDAARPARPVSRRS